VHRGAAGLTLIANYTVKLALNVIEVTTARARFAPTQRARHPEKVWQLALEMYFIVQPA
jgi:hypothetical protein